MAASGRPAAAAFHATNGVVDLSKVTVSRDPDSLSSGGVVNTDLGRDYFHDWSNDSFALGAYTYPKIGGIEASRALAQPINDTLFFAGEADR